VFSQSDKELYDYYQWRTLSYFAGDSSRSWSQHPFQLYQGGPVIVPPRNPEDWERLNPARVIQMKMEKETKLIQNAIVRLNGGETLFIEEEPAKAAKEQTVALKHSDRQDFERYLAGLTPSRLSICEGMVRAIELSGSAREVAEMVCTSALAKIEEADLKGIYARLYLISDILFNAQSPNIPSAWSYRKEFEVRLSKIFEALNVLWTTKIEGLLS